MNGSPDAIALHLSFSGYLSLAVSGICLFCANHLLLHFVIKAVYPKYNTLPARDFHEYRMQVNAIVHAVFTSIFTLYCLFWTCRDGKTFFNDEECRMVPRNSHVWTCFFTSGYLTVETLFILTVTGVHSPIDKQTLVHHILGIFNFYIVFWPQDFTVTVGVAQLLMEASTPFVCMRWLNFHHGLKDSVFQLVNSVCMLVMFLVVRIAYQPYLAYVYMWPYLQLMWFQKEGVSVAY